MNTETEAYKVAARARAEEELRQHPELLDDIRFLIEEGESRFQIKRQIGLPTEVVNCLISRVTTDISEEESQLDQELAADRVYSRKNKQEKNEELLLSVKRLLAEGYGQLRIARELDLDAHTVELLIEESRSLNFLHSRNVGKNEKVSIVDRIKGTGGGAFQIARAMEITPGAAQKIIKRVEGRLSSADESLKMVAARGTTVIKLQNRFGFRSKDQVLDALNDNFPQHFIYQKEKDDGDTAIWVIPDRTNTYDFLKHNRQKKLFRTSVSRENNYMFIQMDPEFQGDHIKLYNLTDVHVGHKAFQRERFAEHVQMIAEDPCAFAVWGGDMFEWAHKMSVGEPWEQILSPMEQIPETGRLLAPIAHKTFAYRSGNHDQGRGKLVGADLAEALAGMMDIPYFKVETLIQIDFTPARLFNILLDHGHSGGSIQSILRDAEKYKESCGFFVHCHLSGHVHNSQIIERMGKEIEIGRGLRMSRSYTAIGGSYLGYTQTYAEQAKYSPTPQDLTYFRMEHDGNYKADRVRTDPA